MNILTKNELTYALTSYPYLGNYSKCHKILDKVECITPQTIKDIPKNSADLLRQITPVRLKELAQLNCFAAEIIKTNLDEQFGKDNYVLISMGQSLSSIAEIVRQLGVNVKQIPISGLRKIDPKETPLSNNDIDVFKTYLESMGLTKDELKKNKEKKYVLIDYTYHGRSLRRMEEFLKQDFLLGDAQNLIKMPVEEALQKEYQNKMFNTLFNYNRFKYFSLVGKLPFTNIKEIFLKADTKHVEEFNFNINQGVRKLFWFNVFDSINKQNYKKIRPINEWNAIYDHYLSPKAVKNYIKREYSKTKNI